MSSRTLQIPFGRSELPVEIDDRAIGAVLKPKSTSVQEGEMTLREALRQPLGTDPLRDIARPGQKVVIVTSDLTRPCPSHRLLPVVLEELDKARIPEKDITVVIALGLHRPMSAAELKRAVGRAAYERVRVINHDPEETVQLGLTEAGTPVEVFRPVVEADLRICLGNIDLHWFAGFSGGGKAIFPGCASEVGVTANHGMMVDPGAAAACLEHNPVRADIEEAAGLVGIDFILNVIVDGEHNVLAAFAGDAIAAHRRGAQLAAERSVVPLRRRGDIVLVSAGGYPKDVNLYQAQKALDNARHAVKPGGVIILVAECCEGFGNTVFETWMKEGGSADAVLNRIRGHFVLGGHKAAGFARVRKTAEVYLVSALPPETASQCGLTSFATIRAAVEAARDALGPSARVVVMPHGGSTLPAVR